MVAACPIRRTYIVFVSIGLVLYTYTCNLCAVKGGYTEKPVTWELHMHEENTTPCETILSLFFKNLANIFANKCCVHNIVCAQVYTFMHMYTL